MCPNCQEEYQFVKSGFYIRKSDKKMIQRYKCKICKNRFSAQTNRIDYRHRKRAINQTVFRLLSKGMSQRGCAFTLGVQPSTIASRVERFGKVAKQNLENYRKQRAKCEIIIFDEMESFEHSKCKPTTMPIAVEEGSRIILALGVGKIAAKGHLSKIAKKKYGYRKCERDKKLTILMEDLKQCCKNDVLIKTDQSNHYPRKVNFHFPEAIHKTFKGRRGCVVGQGELKRGGFDPIFSLNHTCAMFRDNLKRLSRKTWCTTKKIDRLENLLYLYAWFHNLKIFNKNRPLLEVT